MKLTEKLAVWVAIFTHQKMSFAAAMTGGSGAVAAGAGGETK